MKLSGNIVLNPHKRKIDADVSSEVAASKKAHRLNDLLMTMEQKSNMIELALKTTNNGYDFM